MRPRIPLFDSNAAVMIDNDGNPIGSGTDLTVIPVTISGENNDGYSYTISSSGGGDTTGGSGSLESRIDRARP